MNNPNKKMQNRGIKSPLGNTLGFRGEVGVLLHYLPAYGTTETVQINRGDRIAQMVIAPVAYVRWVVTDELPTSERGAGGFGHTGT
jgi:dUTP pyrophosphatase